MTTPEIIELIAMLKASGVTHFKQGDLELTLLPQAVQPALKPTSLAQEIKEPETEVPHIIQEMKSLLKLSDDELVERIFPIKPLDEELN